MPKSLKVMIKKLAHDGKITEEEYNDLLKKLDGHDAEVYDKAIKVLEQTKWIPVSERLPEENGDYLVTIEWKGSCSGNIYTEIDIVEYDKTKKWRNCGVDDYVIAWMPLPELYKAESEDKV